MADCMVLRVIFFKGVVFGMLNYFKLHKNRSGSFFAHKPLQRLDKNHAVVQKHLLIHHGQIRHSTSTHSY
jgi:hypothetical protein